MMSHPKFLPYLVDFETLRRFAVGGVLYRAYDHLIAASVGRVLTVPLIVVQGRFMDVIDGCPVPWEEVYSIIEGKSEPFILELAKMPEVVLWLDSLAPLGLDRGQWQFDLIGVHDDTRRNVLRFTHASGVRFAVAAKFLV
jgi:hypothetical protein